MRSSEYESLIEAFITEEHAMIGDLAYKRASTVEGIHVDDGDIILESTPSESLLRAVFETFESFQGDGAKGIARRAAERARIEPSFLPAEMVPHDPEQDLWAIGAVFAGLLAGVIGVNVLPGVVRLHEMLGIASVEPFSLQFFTPVVLISGAAAMMIGFMMDFVPCSVPVWARLLPEDAEDYQASTFLKDSMGYMTKSLITLAAFGGLLGLMSMMLMPAVMTSGFNVITLLKVIVAMMGVMFLLWGLERYNLLSLPAANRGLRSALQSFQRKVKVINRNVVFGVFYGGSEIGCPIPFYHLLLAWIMISASPVYGVFLLSMYVIGKFVPLIMIGLIVRGSSRKVFDTFRLGQPIVETLEGAMMIMLGAMLLLVSALATFGAEALIVFRMIQSVIAIGIAYAAITIYRWTKPLGWRLLVFTSVTLALWAWGSLLAHSTGGPSTIIDGFGLAVVMGLFSITAAAFLERDLPIKSPAWFSVRNVTIIELVIAGGAFGVALTAVPLSDIAKVMLHTAPVMALPALYGFYRIQRGSMLRTWTYYYYAIILMITGLLAAIYSSNACGTGARLAGDALCAKYMYTIPALTEVPIIPALVQASFMAPLLMLAGIASFGIGSFVFFHKMYRPVRKATSIEGNELERLVRGTLDHMGGLVGYNLARRMIEESVTEVEDLQLTFRDDDDEPVITMAVSIDNKEKFRELVDVLIDTFEETLGPVAQREITTVAEGIVKLESARDQAATAQADLEAEMADRTVAEAKNWVDESGVDPADALAAEIRGKNRKTLKQWLEKQVRKT